MFEILLMGKLKLIEMNLSINEPKGDLKQVGEIGFTKLRLNRLIQLNN